jgi:Cu(I)/Ag(I) efflux system membrane fusion protein
MDSIPHDAENGNSPDRVQTSVGHSPRTAWQRLRLVFKVVEIRLRFIAILVVIWLVVGYWDAIKNHWDKQTRPDGAVQTVIRKSLGPRAAQWLWPQAEGTNAVEADTEFFCPMHPTVIRTTTDPDGSVPKCPICGMPLSVRKKGEAISLPSGVLSRKQYSPEQIEAAGIGTAEVGYRPLEKIIRTVGYVTYDESRRSQIVVRVSGYLEKLYVDKPWITVKDTEPLGEIYSPELYSSARELLLALERGGSKEMVASAREKLRLLGIGEHEIEEIVNTRKANPRLVLRSPRSGHLVKKEVIEGAHVEAGQMLFEIADLSQVWIEAEVYESDIEFVRNGQAIEASVEAFPGRVFAANLSLVHPHLDSATRTNAVRFQVANLGHELRPGMFASVRIKTPLSTVEPFRTRLARSPSPSPVQAGEILAVPERSVIDTGTRKIVYVERKPGLFEGVEVQLGSAVGGFCPVIEGLHAGDRVAERGAFLVDAETRLNPGASATYVGAGGGPQQGSSGNERRLSSPPAKEHSHHHDEPLTHHKTMTAENRQKLAKLEPADRVQAIAQGVCPISHEPLGSMGTPYKITLKGRPVYLCCQGCEAQARKDSDAVLSTLDRHATGRMSESKRREHP